jgi:hypothetical protein
LDKEGAGEPIKRMPRYLRFGETGEVRSTPTSASDCLPDRLKNRLDVVSNDSILESNYFESHFLQERCALGFVLFPELAKMRRSIQFNGKIALRAEEVDDIAPYAALTTKLSA